MKINDPHSGNSKYFKGRGRSGKKILDDYQKLLLEQEKLNLLEQKENVKQDRQPPLSGQALKEYKERMKNTMGRKGRSV